MKRVQVYYKDMGLYRKEYVATVEDGEFESINSSKLHKAVELVESDWYGHKQPDVLR